MREIKFRALNANGEFVYGIPYTDGVNDTFYFEDYRNIMCWRDENGVSCNQPYKNGTLQQFTGLKDKNGVDIFEGDILKYTAHNGYTLDSCNMTVFYDNESACFGYKTMLSMFPEIIFPFSQHDELQEDILNHADIIGNIHDNPELIQL